jgi:hypothetical protein
MGQGLLRRRVPFDLTIVRDPGPGRQRRPRRALGYCASVRRHRRARWEAAATFGSKSTSVATANQACNRNETCARAKARFSPGHASAARRRRARRRNAGRSPPWGLPRDSPTEITSVSHFGTDSQRLRPVPPPPPSPDASIVGPSGWIWPCHSITWVFFFSAPFLAEVTWMGNLIVNRSPFCS